jgi:glucose dehydrogenase
MKKKFTFLRNVGLIATAIAASQIAYSQQEDLSKWTHYGGNQAGTQYSSLDQITTDNVADLEEIWRYRNSAKVTGSRSRSRQTRSWWKAGFTCRPAAPS